jgi:hypothetical protein
MHSLGFASPVCIYGYMLFQRCAGYVAIPYEPELLVGVPSPASRLDHCSQGQVGSRDPERNQGFRGVTSRGGVQSVFSIISSTVFSRWHVSASYLNRTQTSAALYFFTSLLVPRCPGLRTRRVFMPRSGR